MFYITICLLYKQLYFKQNSINFVLIKTFILADLYVSTDPAIVLLNFFNPSIFYLLYTFIVRN